MLLISRNADQQNLPRISVAENARESYIPSGIDVGIDFDNDRCTLLKTQEGFECPDPKLSRGVPQSNFHG